MFLWVRFWAALLGCLILRLSPKSVYSAVASTLTNLNQPNSKGFDQNGVLRKAAPFLSPACKLWSDTLIWSNTKPVDASLGKMDINALCWRRCCRGCCCSDNWSSWMFVLGQHFYLPFCLRSYRLHSSLLFGDGNRSMIYRTKSVCSETFANKQFNNATDRLSLTCSSQSPVCTTAHSLLIRLKRASEADIFLFPSNVSIANCK